MQVNLLKSLSLFPLTLLFIAPGCGDEGGGSDGPAPAVDITGNWLILRYHFTAAPAETPFPSELDETRFVQDGTRFTQFFGPDDDVGFEGTVAGPEYTQTGEGFGALLRFEDADHGTGTYEQGALTASFAFVRIGAPAVDVAGEDWLADDGSGTTTPVIVALDGDALTVQIGSQRFSGRMGRDTGLLLGDPQPSNSGLAARLDWTSASAATLTRYTSTWTPDGAGHTGFSATETTLALTRPTTGETCQSEDDCDSGQVCDGTCRPRRPGDPCGQGGTCPGQLQCVESTCQAVGPVDCELSAFGEWGACSAECGGGEQSRSRTVVVEPANGGQACDALEETRACNETACPSGLNLAVATYDGGAFVQLNSVDWVENTEISNHPYVEIDRDEAAVTLERSDGVYEIELNVTTEVITVREVASGDVLGSYDIVAMNPATSNGWSASRASFDGGGFVQINPTTWLRNGSDVFQVELRDPWSVYLVGGGSFVLDFFTLQFAERGGDILYPITEADPAALDAWTAREVLYDGGRFVQTTEGVWTAYTGAGETEYDQGDRTQWTIELSTPMEGDDSFEIDLEEGVIRSLSLGDPDRTVTSVR